MNDDLNPGITALRNQVFILLVALVVISGTLTVYLYREARLLGKDVEANQNVVNNYNQGQPALSNFVNQLGAYSVTHAEIRPVLAKYGIIPAATQPNLGTPTPPAPKK